MQGVLEGVVVEEEEGVAAAVTKGDTEIGITTTPLPGEADETVIDTAPLAVLSTDWWLKTCLAE